MRIQKVLLALVALAVTIYLSGCEVVEAFNRGFQEGVNGALSPSTTSEKEVQTGSNGPFYKTLKDSNASKQQKLDALNAQILAGDQYLQQVAAIRRFGIEYDIDIPTNPNSEKVNKILTALHNDKSGFFEKSVWLEQDFELFQGKYYKTKEDDHSSITLYYGDIKNGRPDGYGMIYYLYSGDFFPEEENILIIDYIGHFSKGRRDGYGLQYYPPTDFQLDGPMSQIVVAYLEDRYDLDVDLIVHNNDDVRLCSCDWCNYYRLTEELVVELYLNIVVYEGEFKNNTYNGKGVMDLKYDNTFHDYGESIEVNDMRSCYRRVLDGNNDCSILIIGDFKDGDESDNCTTYYGSN